MNIQTEQLGKVSVTVEKDYHNINKCYDKLTIVEEENEFRTYISRKPVPSGVELTDRNYWIPFSSLERQIVIDYNKFKNDVLFASAFHEKLDPTLPEGVAIIKQLFDKDNNPIIPKVSEEAVSDETGKTLKAKLAELTTTLSNTINTYLNTYFADTIEKAEDIVNHPTYIGEDNYVYVWNRITKTYDKTSIYTRGEGFHVSKTFASVADMEAYTGTDLKEGDFVLIQSTPDDPDNGKLYTYSGTQGVYKFLVDMSGAIGFTGKTPQFSIGSVITIEPAEQASASLSPDGTDSDGNPKYKLNLALPKGESGNAFWERGTGTNSAKLKGGDNIVAGDNSVAVGEHNYVEGKDSFAAGNHNTLSSNYNNCFGQYNVVRGSNSTVIGTINVSDNQNCYVEGFALRNSGKFSHIEGYGRIDLTISGVANSTTYTIVEDLPAMFIGSYIGLIIDNGFLYTTITAIDAVNHTITLFKTLNPDSDFVNKSVRLLCSQNLQEDGHVEGKYNILLLDSDLVENPLIDSFIGQYYNTHSNEIEAAHIEGYGNICSGRTSHVEGNFNIAIKSGSHAEGRRTRAIASNAHSEGYNTTASGQQAHAEGKGTQALGRYSHSEGTGTIISEDCYSGHSEGYCTGVFNTSGGHSEGYGTWCADSSAPHVEGYGRFSITLTGAADSLEYSVSPLPEDWWLETYLCDNNGGTAKMIKITAIDKINSTITFETTLGALTNSTRYFIAGSYAKGGCNHVEGYVNRTYASGSHVEGARNIIESTGRNAHVEGAYNRATKLSSHVEGIANVATGEASHAEGRDNRAYGDYSHVEGFCNTALGNSSRAGGDGSLNVVLTGNANATTYNVHIQPKDTWVGKLIKPSNLSSNAVVYISAIDAVNKTITVTETLDAENPITAAVYYIALGGAYHDNSFAHGRGVTTGMTEQAVFGRYNIPLPNALFIIGNGTSENNQSNAFYLDINGNMYIAGNIVSTQIQQLESRIAALEAVLNNNSNN